MPQKNNKIIITISNKEKNSQNNRVIIDRCELYGYFTLLENLYSDLGTIKIEESPRLTKK